MPSLNRLILINTHLSGVVELVVDDHTNICGTNASGKTTLQRLVPVFYGEYPSRVVPATRDSFQRWYLPTEQSYIVYEYQRMDGELCQAVLSSSSDGKGVDYRLVQKGFELEDYIRSRDARGDVFFHTPAELGRALRSAGVEQTTLINTRQFRAIIQNDRTLLSADSERSQLRAWARQFSLCEGSHSLRHIEKLARAVHSREGKMETIKSMVAAILEEDGVNPPTANLNPARVDEWIRDSKLVQGFQSMRPQFNQLEQDFQHLEHSERRLAGLHRRLAEDEPQLFQRGVELTGQIEEAAFALSELEARWQEQRDDLNQRLSVERAEVQRCDAELQGIENEYQNWLDQDIDQLKNDLQQIPSWQTDLDNYRARHRLLTSEHEDVEREYQERRQTINEQLAAVIEQLRGDEDSRREALDQQKARRDEALSALEQDWQARREQGQAGFRERRHQLELQAQEQQHRIEALGYSEEESAELALLDQRIEDAEERIEAAEADARAQEQQEARLRQQRDEASRVQQQASRLLAERQKQLEALERILFPGEHTLLEFLRREQPGWETGLGKVIRPDLLARTDLKPHSTEGSSLFGVRLDLTAIDSPEHAASESELRQRCQQAEDARTEADAAREQADAALAQATAKLDDWQQRLVLQRSKLRQQQDERKRLREERRSRKEQLDARVQERRSAARKLLVELKDATARLDSEAAQWLENLKAQHAGQRLELASHWQQIIGDIEQQLLQLRDTVRQRKTQAQLELDSCLRWYQAELKQRGVDEQAITSLKREIETLAERIRRTEQRRTEVLSYEHWYRTSWQERKPKLLEQQSRSRSQADELKQQLDSASERHRSQRSELEARHRGAKQDKAAVDALHGRVRTLVKRLGELRLPREGEPLEGGLEERLRLGDELLAERERLQEDVRKQVNNFDNLIAGQAGSGLAETWDHSRSECERLNEHNKPVLEYRLLVPKLAQLLNVLVPQRLTALREQGRIFGVALHQVYEVLTGIDRRIASQSQRITREVDEELFLDGVSESAVRIRSKITELEYWPELKQFARAYEHWRDSGFSELPDDDYTGSMRRALDILGRSTDGGGIAALLEIELRLREGNSDLVIRTDRALNESSSHGMAYLILCKFLLAFTRLLRGDAPAIIHWPIDELGTLHHNNVKKIFDACTSNRIRILGAFPNPDSEALALFANRYIVDKRTRKLQVVKPRLDPLAERLRQRSMEVN